MNIFLINFGVSFVVFAIALIGGMIPIWLATTDRTRYLFALGNSLARGIFLGVGFMHLLPEANSALTTALGSDTYPFVTGLCAITIILLLFIEQSLSDYFNKRENPSNVAWLPYFIAVLLSTHSILAGTALGLEHEMTGFLMIFTAIIAHKGSEAFALGMSMENHQMSRQRTYNILILFALMTPLGIFCGATFSIFTNHHFGKLTEGIFNSIAAGTFIYIAMLDKLGSCSHCQSFEKISNLANLALIFLGFAIISGLAVWV